MYVGEGGWQQGAIGADGSSATSGEGDVDGTDSSGQMWAVHCSGDTAAVAVNKRAAAMVAGLQWEGDGCKSFEKLQRSNIRCRPACKRVESISTPVLSAPISNTSFRSGNAKTDIDGIVAMKAP
ncbi:hypothetical protein B296_00035494 [Ensete ventricosum]|uniref:Uncharacterized protein n=1 Tax=Ensete ventricosum TaxID=4639 RepID=A0A426Y3K8_ENSVE|nr:hypothetical protein B296_00035494 [Ensete ventricosum]